MAELYEYQLASIEKAVDNVAPVVVGATGFLNGAHLHLSRTDVDIGPANVLADFTTGECDYVGYAAQVLVWGVPTVSDDGTVEVVSVAQIYKPTNAVTPNVANTAFVTNAADDALYYACTLDNAPLPFNSALDQTTVIVRYRPSTRSLLVTIS